MEEVILKTLSANKDERTQATKQIVELTKDSAAFHQFWFVVVRSNDVNVRQAAAMYFYRMIQKKKKWLQLPNEMRNNIKTSILERIIQEPEKIVKTTIVQSAGQLALNELDSWPELFKLIEDSMASDGVPELGMFVISIMTEYATPLFELHTPSLLNLFGSIITKTEHHGTPLGFLTVMSMKNFLLFYSRKEKSTAQSFEFLVPYVFEVIKAQSARSRHDRSVECLAFFEALLDSYPRIISNNLKSIIEGLLRTAILLNVDEISTRVLNVISCLICRKTKKLAKDDDILRLLCQTLFEIISSPLAPDSGIVEHYDVFSGDVNKINTAVEVLDTLATEIEPDVVLKHIMPILDAAATGDNMFAKKAVFIILGVLVENCPKQIRASGFDRILLFIKDGLNSTFPLPLNGSMFALWRFIEHLKADVNLYLMDFMTPLLQLLDDTNGRFRIVEEHLVPKMFYVLSECCETLESALEPILQFMVPVLLSIVKSNTKIHYRELAINVLGQAGIATKKAFREYFSAVLEVLRPFLTDSLPAEQLPLQVQTFDTLGTLFKSLYVKGDRFQLVEDVIELTLSITERKNCGELRSGLYSMLSDCSEFMKEKMERHLPLILKLMNQSFESQDVLDGEQGIGNTSSLTMNVEGEIEKKRALLKDMKIIEEKEEALMALGNLSYNIGAPFQPYFKESYLICYQLSSHENQVIRAAAVSALANIYIAIKRCYPNEETSGIPRECLQIVSKFAELVRIDENVDVVYAVLEGYQKILKDIPQIVPVPVSNISDNSRGTTNGTLIAGVVKTVLTEKSVCQNLKMKEDDSDEDDGSDADSEDDKDSEDEIDDNYSLEDLIVAVEEIIPLLGEAVSSDVFVVFFCSCQRHLLKLLEKNQPNDIRESTSATLGICAKYLSSYINEFAVEFAPIIPTLIRDANDSVRNNVAFCLAQMVLCGKEAMFSYYNDISATLLNWLVTERSSMVVDNICGAIASMIVIDLERLPLNNILPAFFRFLPLREDFDENDIVFRSFNTLLERDGFKEYFTRMVEVVLMTSMNKQIVTDGARLEVNKLFERISRCYSNEKKLLLLNLSEELRNHFFVTFSNIS